MLIQKYLQMIKIETTNFYNYKKKHSSKVIVRCKNNNKYINAKRNGRRKI